MPCSTKRSAAACGSSAVAASRPVGPAAAAALITSEEDAIRLAREEIDKWHAADTGDVNTARLHVAVVPRFSLAVTTQTLKSLGDLYDSVRGRGVYFHSHLNENNRPGTGEVDETKDAYQVDSYLDTYDGKFLPGSTVGGASMLGRRSIMAHAVHCQDVELERMAQTGTSISHCPISQQFLGSGTMPWLRTVASGVNVSAGTDFGGGDEWLIPQVIGAAFKVHIGEPGDAGVSMHPAEMLFLGTLGGARALDMEDRFGNLDVGKEADFVVVDPRRTAGAGSPAGLWCAIRRCVDGARPDAVRVAHGHPRDIDRRDLRCGTPTAVISAACPCRP